MRRMALAALLIALIAMLVPGVMPAQVTDAHVLGVWSGEWKVEQSPGIQTTPRRGLATNGSYEITISKVDNGRVSGLVRQSGVPASEYKLVGRIEGNVLSYSADRYHTKLTIDGDRMKGRMLGGTMPWDISLQKQK